MNMYEKLETAFDMHSYIGGNIFNQFYFNQFYAKIEPIYFSNLEHPVITTVKEKNNLLFECERKPHDPS